MKARKTNGKLPESKQERKIERRKKERMKEMED